MVCHLTSQAGMPASRARSERLWKDFFRDPSQWWDKRNTKRAPDFQHRLTMDSLCMLHHDGSFNPSWVQDMLRLEKAEEPGAMKGMHSAQEEMKQNSTSWEMCSLEETLGSLSEGNLPMPSVEDFASILHKCRKERNLAHTAQLHAYLQKNGLEVHPSLGNDLVWILVEFGSLCDAQQVFDRLVHRNEFSWNSLITGYVKSGEAQHALNLYQKMQEDDSLHPTPRTFVALLKACAKLKDLKRGSQVHAEVARKGLLEQDVFVGSTLVDMYAKCGSLAKAQEVFDKLTVRDVVSWTALITGYVEEKRGEDALHCFEQMQYEGISPDDVTFACSLKACGSIGATEKGREIHADIFRKCLEKDLFIGNTLIDMYAKFGSLADAQGIFDKLSFRDVVSWNALIAGYAENGHGEEALNCFQQMQHEGVSPHASTFVCSLKACGSIGAIESGREIHAEISRKGLERNLFIGSTLVDMYAKCGLLAKSQEVFDKLPVRNVVSWTALITGYAEHGQCEEALNCFKRMEHEGISPVAVTFVCTLKACGGIGATDKGWEIHTEIAKKGLERDLVIGSTLVDMYTKCASLKEAAQVFDFLSVRDVVSWTALIAGYAQLGESENVFHTFDRMIGEGMKPNLVTFGNVLNACNHTGLVDKGQMYFETMSKVYGIIPTLEHHTCMVGLLGRAGHLDKAIVMIKKMPFHPGNVMWHALLAASQKWGNVEVGRQAFEHAVWLDEKDATAYVCMSNIYADVNTQEDVNKVEAKRMEKHMEEAMT